MEIGDLDKLINNILEKAKASTLKKFKSYFDFICKDPFCYNVSVIPKNVKISNTDFHGDVWCRFVTNEGVRSRAEQEILSRFSSLNKRKGCEIGCACISKEIFSTSLHYNERIHRHKIWTSSWWRLRGNCIVSFDLDFDIEIKIDIGLCVNSDKLGKFIGQATELLDDLVEKLKKEIGKLLSPSDSEGQKERGKREEAPIDLWSIVHFLSGFLLGILLNLLGFSVLTGFIIAAIILILWEIIEPKIWSGWNESWKNIIADIIIGLLGFLVAKFIDSLIGYFTIGEMHFDLSFTVPAMPSLVKLLLILIVSWIALLKAGENMLKQCKGMVVCYPNDTKKEIENSNSHYKAEEKYKRN